MIELQIFIFNITHCMGYIDCTVMHSMFILRTINDFHKNVGQVL